MPYNPKYLRTPGQIHKAIKEADVIMDGKAYPESSDKLQLRFLFPKDVSLSISTVPGDAEPTWENAHSHGGLDEVYTVYQGMIVIVWTKDGEDHFEILQPGGTFMVYVGVEHNVFVFPNTIMATAKLGESVPNWDNRGNDWWPAPELDHRSKQFTTAEAVLTAAGLYAP